MKKTFNELKLELESEIAWFESGDVNIEDAAAHYQKARELLTELEKILSSSQLVVKKLK